jgi:hypothetical protein
VGTREVLVVFARYPRAGLVKTRLGRDIGDQAATELYAAFLRDLAARFAPAPFALRWAVAPPDPGFADWLGVAPSSCFAQAGDDLGARMRAAFVAMRADGFEHSAVIGSDAPQLSRAVVEQAFGLLSRCDVVLGPAVDGGYYLIAMSEPRDVFSGIAWSSLTVLADTRARAAALDLRVAELATSFDVDRGPDLDRLRALLDEEESRREMPATAAVLAGLPRRRG